MSQNVSKHFYALWMPREEGGVRDHLAAAVVHVFASIKERNDWVAAAGEDGMVARRRRKCGSDQAQILMGNYSNYIVHGAA